MHKYSMTVSVSNEAKQKILPTSRPLAGRRILYVVNNPDFFVSHRVKLAKSARAAGAEVHTASPQGAGETILRDAGFHHHTFPLERWGMNPVGELRSLCSLVSLYRKIKPDIVHQITVKPVLYGTIAARVTRVPAVINSISGLGQIFTSRGILAALRRRLVLMAYRSAFASSRVFTIVQNLDDRELFVSAGITPQDRVNLIRGAGVDPREFTVTPEPSGVPVVLVSARLVKAKGVGEFVEAVRILKSTGMPFRAVLAGQKETGIPDAIPDSEIAAWESEGIVEHWGFRTDMAEVLAQSSIVCLPSYREGMPKSLIEAAAAGRPLVASDVPGCREIVRDGHNGYLFPNKDSEAMADALRKLITDPALRAEFGRNSRKIFDSEYTDEQVIRATFELYTKSLANSGL